MTFAIVSLSGAAFAADSTTPSSGSAMEKGKATASNMMAACKDDKVKYCDKMSGTEAIKSCLSKNKESLTPECKSSLHL